jgi:hypothetical protein
MITLNKRWTASRTGSKPQIPPRINPDANWVYVSGYDGLPDLKVAPDGVSIQYQVEGVYTYQALNPATVTRDAESAPFLNSTALTAQKGWFATVVDLSNTVLQSLPFSGSGALGGNTLGGGAALGAGGGTGGILLGGSGAGIGLGSGGPILGGNSIGGGGQIGVINNANPLGLGNVPISGLPIGGFSDLSGASPLGGTPLP